MLRIYLVRHGETLWNLEKRLQGWGDSPLSERGINNAKLLGEYLKNIDFSCAYASTSSRAYDTAELILGERNIKVIKLDDLREISFGVWEGKVIHEIEKEEPEKFTNFWKKPHLYKTEEGEHFEDLRIRALTMLNKIVKENSCGNILVVTHTVFIKTVLSIIKNTSTENIWDPPFIYDTSLTILEYNEEKFKITLEAERPHI